MPTKLMDVTHPWAKSVEGENETEKKKVKWKWYFALLFKEHLALRKQELIFLEKKQEDFMKLIVQQQQQQSKQMQDFQALTFTLLNKSGPKIILLLMMWTPLARSL